MPFVGNMYDQINQFISIAVVHYNPSLITFRDKHNEALLHILSTQSSYIIVSLATGYGKSVIFHIMSIAFKKKLNKDNCVMLVICSLNIIQDDQIIKLADLGIEDAKDGKYSLVFAHPEALFCTKVGRTMLMDSPLFPENVLGLSVNECHTVVMRAMKNS